MEKIVIENLSVGGKCDLFHHGVVQDYLDKKSFKFCSGHLYGIIGEFGSGGAALSCGITGNTNFYEGKIVIDDKENTIETLIDNSWYVGNDLHKRGYSQLFVRRPKIMKKTIREQIEQGVRGGKQELDLHTIQNMFDISNERIDRNIEYVSGERWKASVAIGYANGKKVFCFPWLNSKDIERLEVQLSNTVKQLLNSECIVIIPTTKEENIKRIHSEGDIVLL